MSAADLAAAAAAALKAEAANDLAVLQTYAAVVGNPASTVQQCADATAAALAGLANGDRIAAIQQLSAGWTQLVGGLETEISKANAAAGN
jgi:hypothetical protein